MNGPFEKWLEEIPICEESECEFPGMILSCPPVCEYHCKNADSYLKVAFEVLRKHGYNPSVKFSPYDAVLDNYHRAWWSTDNVYSHFVERFGASVGEDTESLPVTRRDVAVFRIARSSVLAGLHWDAFCSVLADMDLQMDYFAEDAEGVVRTHPLVTRPTYESAPTNCQLEINADEAFAIVARDLDALIRCGEGEE